LGRLATVKKGFDADAKIHAENKMTREDIDGKMLANKIQL